MFPPSKASAGWTGISARDRAGLVSLGIGAGLALLFLLPVFRFAGWFLRSLVHEIGHAATAWALGRPAVPAIRLDGHAAAVHGDLLLPLALLVWGGIVFLAVKNHDRPIGRILLIPAAMIYPALAFTGLSEIVFLSAGHLSELVFAGIFLHRALTGGFTGSPAERPLYAALGWYWCAAAAVLATGLLFSPAARAAYAAIRSFGLANDLERLAALTPLPMGVIAALLLLLSLAAPAAAWTMSGAGRRLPRG